MKSLIAVFALLAVSASSALADGQLLCKSAPNRFGGFTAITLVNVDAYDATLEGTVSGGMAQFIRRIPATNLKVQHEVDATIYSNTEEGMVLTVVTSPIDGILVTSASFQEGAQTPAVSMSCTEAGIWVDRNI
jgi:hypothetical protein